MQAEPATETEIIIDGDLLYGVYQIAKFLGIETRQARHQCEVKRLPSFKLGQLICSRRSTLWRWLDEQEAGASEPEADSATADASSMAGHNGGPPIEPADDSATD